jgi:hypothetical protein
MLRFEVLRSNALRRAEWLLLSDTICVRLPVQQLVDLTLIVLRTIGPRLSSDSISDQ